MIGDTLKDFKNVVSEIEFYTRHRNGKSCVIVIVGCHRIYWCGAVSNCCISSLHSASAKIRHPSFSCGHFNCIEKLVFPLNQYMVHKFLLQSVAANAHIHWQRMTCQTVLQMETRSVKGKGL